MVQKIEKEMHLFENEGTRGHHLDSMSTPTTSIESERAFSVAAYMGNKL